MKKNTRIAVVIMLIMFLVAGYLVMRSGEKDKTITSEPTKVMYVCDAGKSINATYYQGQVIPNSNPDLPPTSTATVSILLSDGREENLPQVVSADGSRYANADESMVFWSKGRGLMFTENGKQNFTNCIEVVKDPGGLSNIYENGKIGFSLRYPLGFTVSDTHKYLELGPNKDISGVRFTIDPSISNGTNLSSGTYLSVENIPNSENCSAELFLRKGPKAISMEDGNFTYSVASSSDAGAGNRYEETVYAIPTMNSCVAIRYFIHYSAFENYPEGSTKEFDREELVKIFDSIRRTLVTS